jgi:HK97 family phage prohead protease
MTKDTNKYSLKATESIKDLDIEKREVAIYLSAFDTIDSDMDVIKKGAFKKSIKERGVNSKSNRKIAFLRYHDWEHQIGKFLTLEEDDKGLFAVAQLGTSSKGEDAFRDYDEGIIKEHSIGFQYVEDKIKFIEDKDMESGGFFEVKEVKLWEGSAVTFGANENTNVVDVIKAADKPDYALKIFKEIEILQKSLANGQGTDERLYGIEMKLKYLQSQMLLLAQSDPLNKQSFKQANDHDNATKSFDWNKVLQNMKK